MLFRNFPHNSGMVSDVYLRATGLLLLVAIIASSSASPYLENEVALDDGDVYDSSLDSFQPLQEKRNYGGQIYMPSRRACIRRNGNCDNRLTECCDDSACRCNLWGSNCRCQALTLVQKFRKWG